jgi:hypothetical protein
MLVAEHHLRIARLAVVAERRLSGGLPIDAWVDELEAKLEGIGAQRGAAS